MKFKIDDKVKWSRNGVDYRGSVLVVVPPNVPVSDVEPMLKPCQWVSRPEESYIVQVGNRFYRPHVKHLQPDTEPADAS